MKKYALTIFNNQFAMEPQPAELSWDELKSLFSEFNEGDFDKTKQTHFNGCRFKEGAQRFQDDVEALHILVLDFDNGMPLARAKAHFKNLRHIGYTSYNHQFDKHGDGEVVDKFRILLPLSEPCPLDKWLEIRHNVADFAPGVDMASVRLHQPFAVPIKRPNIEGDIWHNEGPELPWRGWKKKVTIGPEYTTADPSYSSGHELTPDFILRTKNGNIRIGDVKETINNVYCPFHDDKSPGAFVSISPKGNTFLFCRSKCGTTFVKQPEESFIEGFLEDRKKEKLKFTSSKEKQHEKIKEAVGLVEIDEEVQPPFTRERRSKMLQKHCLNKTENQILNAFEGFGKSHLAVLKARAGQKVVFACISNKQAQEQYESFVANAPDLNIQLIVSREEKLRTIHQIECESSKRQHPWDAGNADQTKTRDKVVKEGKKTKKEFDAIWDECKADKPNFSNDIIVTTHSRVHIWGMIQVWNLGEHFDKNSSHDTEKLEKLIIPRKTVVFFDDCAAKDFEHLTDFSNEWADAKIDGVPIETVDRGNRRYFVRPEKYFYGYGLFFCQLIFSTTELYTHHLIKKRYPGIDEPPLMPKKKMYAGDITVISTRLVYSKTDGIIPCIIQRLKKEGFPVSYFADGQGNVFNLVNNKGQNIFKNNDVVVEISQPTSGQVIRMCDELDLDAATHGNFVKVVYCMDRAHQAIGRNSGYRWSDQQIDYRREAIVLMDPKIVKLFLEHSRYFVRRVLNADEIIAGSRKQPKDTVGDCLMWYLRNYIYYMTHDNWFRFDAKSAISELPLKSLQKKRRERIIKAISTIQIRLARPEDGEKLDAVVREIA